MDNSGGSPPSNGPTAGKTANGTQRNGANGTSTANGTNGAGAANGAGVVNSSSVANATKVAANAGSVVANGGKPANGSNGGHGGNGAKAGAKAALQQRAADREFQNVLSKTIEIARRKIVVVGIFSLAANLLLLAMPIYLFQLSDRVYTSRSTDTLVMLSVVVVGAIAAYVFLDMMRRLILTRIAVETESRLGDPQQLRAFITGPVILMMLDAPVAPFYLLAVYMIHPQLGMIVTVTGVALMVIALLNQKLTAVPFAQANTYATRANLASDAMARNAQ